MKALGRSSVKGKPVCSLFLQQCSDHEPKGEKGVGAGGPFNAVISHQLASGVAPDRSLNRVFRVVPVDGGTV